MRLIVLLVSLLSTCWPVFSSASVITTLGYDIIGAGTSGTFGFSHYYDGERVDRTSPSGRDYVDYYGGSGTLNNGNVEFTAEGIQLFNAYEDLEPSITFFFDGLYSIKSIYLNGGNYAANFLVGQLNGLWVSAGDESQWITTSPQGLSTNSGGLADDFADLTQSNLTNIITDKVTLFGFSGYSAKNTFTLTEVTFDGERYQSYTKVSEPGTLLLLILSIIMINVGKINRIFRLLKNK